MFYKVSLTFLLLLLLQYGYTQSKETTVKLGANISSFTKINKPKLAFHGGVSNSLPISKYISIRPELVLSIQGNGRSDKFVDDNIWYVNLPLGIQYRKANTFWRFGPQFGTVIFVNDKKQGAETDIAYYNPVDLSLFLGFGFLISEKLDAELRYNRGLKKVINDYSNVVFQLSIHYQLTKKEKTHE